MPEWRPPAPIELDYKLRQDFQRRLEDVGIRQDETDPLLSVLFRSFAAQVAGVYEQAQRAIPVAILDEMMSGLGMVERRAQPAQAVLKFTVEEGQQVFEAATGLVGETEGREKLTFALDTALAVSTAQLALVAVYQDGMLQLHQGTELQRPFRDAQASPEAVPAELGPTPALYLALDVDAQLHLSQHGFYFELGQDAQDLVEHLQREVWCLLDHEGQISADGLLRPKLANGGVQRLEWLVPESDSLEQEATVILPEGFYGSRVFLFPEVPPARRFRTKVPRKMETPLRRIFQAADKQVQDRLFDKERVWLRIGLPSKVKTVTADLVRIVLHCTTASNVEVLNETIYFSQQGTAIPTNNGGGRARHLVKMLSLKGEVGTRYLLEGEPSADEYAGRFRIRPGAPEGIRGNDENWQQTPLAFRQGWLEIKPATTARGEADAYVNIRLLVANGKLGNAVEAGKINTLLSRANPRTLKITNLNRANGGTDGDSFAHVKARFAELLLTRERPVTLVDLEATIKAFEPKIRAVKTTSDLERCATGLRRVQLITVSLERDSFALPDTEVPILQRELQAELQQRSLLGLDVRVEVEWL